MASDIDDYAELIPNHNEAWSLAVMKRGTSNMARAYVELRELAAKSVQGPLSVHDHYRLKQIIHSNDI